MEFKKRRWMEGDFIENLDGVIFNVKGYLHPNNYVVAFVRYVPDPRGDRRRDSRKYLKLNSLEEKIRFLKQRYPDYLVFDKIFDEMVCEVPHKEILKEYDPKRKAKEILSSKDEDPLKSKMRRFIEVISSHSNVSTNSFGVSGSLLLDLHTKDSDIDPLVYGSENCYRVYETLKELSKNSEKIRTLNKMEIKALYRAKLLDTFIDLELFTKMMKERVMEGIFEDTLFSIRFLKDPGEIKEEYGEIRFKDLGEVEIEGKVVDASEAIFTPCRYVLSGLRILHGSSSKEIREVSSFRSRFCDLAKEGDTIRARGKLELVKTKDEEYLRVLVGGKRSHFMVKVS
ncbi:MAG TPA: hypothetical protein EYP68_00155 [Candidatus Korarchaeota archaeon]|nr:hypothetical protein [Candidatus Korarchaeota archaeon]